MKDNHVLIMNRSNGAVFIATKSAFFKDPVIFSDNGIRLSFKKPTIDYNGKLKKFTFYDKKGKLYQSSIRSEIPLGEFEIDEESNEDELIIYYK